jgi:hypothetical protein
MLGTRETAELFIEVGGRLMVAPTGEVEAQINAGLALSLTADPADTQRVITASRAIDQVIDAEPRAIANMISQRGHRTDAGWLVWKGDDIAPKPEGR